MSGKTIARKDHHLDVCAWEDVEAASSGGPLFDDVALVHEALPDISPADLELSMEFLGRRLSLPLMVTAITGGTERGKAFNQALARQASARGIAIGLGSQRAMDEHPEAAPTFQVKEVAPDAVVVGNIGLWQARAMGVDRVKELARRVGADAMAVHLNVAQELVQPEGDRDFGGGLSTIASLAEGLEGRLLVKETGCGISPATARRLVEAGVRAIDVSGMGGTSWVKVEGLRSATGSRSRRIADEFAGWGIPTAPCVAAVRSSVGGDVTLVASGGVRSGLSASKALALGADVAGIALPCLKAWERGGEEALSECLDGYVQGLRMAMTLCGARSVSELRRKPLVEGSAFRRWKEALAAAV